MISRRKIEQVRNIGSEKFGVNSTPTFFINGKRFNGAMEISDLEKQIAPYSRADQGFPQRNSMSHHAI